MRNLFVSLVSSLALLSCGDNLTPPPQDVNSDDAPRADDSIPDRDPYQVPAEVPLACVPNLDTKIDASELKVAFNATASYIVPPAGETRTVDLIGTGTDANATTWDWGADVAGDQVAKLAAAPLTGKWYAGKFPHGQFAVPVDLGDTVEAVNAIDETAGVMWLYGIASKDPGPSGDCDASGPHSAGDCTLYVYDPPIAALRFPIKTGGDWTSTGVVTNGTLRGLPFASHDTYHVRVDAMGELILPDLTFKQVHRVRTDVTINSLAGIQTQKQVSFYFECFGEVARATSQVGETSDDFTNAIEVRRLGL